MAVHQLVEELPQDPLALLVFQTRRDVGASDPDEGLVQADVEAGRPLRADRRLEHEGAPITGATRQEVSQAVRGR